MRLKKSFLKRTAGLRARLFDYPLKPLEEDPAFSASDPVTAEEGIPAAVYQTWEDNAFGKRHLAALRQFRNTNADLAFFLFDGGARDRYMADVWGSHPISRIYERVRFGPMKADIFRYCIIHERGGYYFDINKGVSVPVRSLHDSTSQGLLSFEPSECNLLPDKEVLELLPCPGRYVIQWSFGFAAGHPILKTMIDYICDCADYFNNKELKNPKSGILQLTGPGMFTKAVRDTLRNDPGLAAKMTFLDENYSGTAVINLPGSDVRYVAHPPYYKVRNAKILAD